MITGTNLGRKNKPMFRLIASELRVRQWIKNSIVLAPLLFAGMLGHWHAFLSASYSALAFCLIASSIYVFNDMRDLKADQLHPIKSSRPLASGKLSLGIAWLLAVVCFFAGLIIAYRVRPLLLLICLVYVFVNVAYSIWLKHIVLVDILCVSSGFVLRALAGAVAIHVPASSWFLLCTTFGSIFLSLEKRRQEIVVLAANANKHRPSLRGYTQGMILRMDNLLSSCTIITYSFYTFQSPHGQWMMLTIPFVLYGLMRYQYISEQGTLTSTPENVFWKDRPMQITVILWIITCLFVIYLHPAMCFHKMSIDLDNFWQG